MKKHFCFRNELTERTALYTLININQGDILHIHLQTNLQAPPNNPRFFRTKSSTTNLVKHTTSLKKFITILRVHQYTKNTFIFLPLFFSLDFANSAKLASTFFAFCSFSMIASSIYIFNDLIDIKADQQHPKKKLRPLPSGQLTIKSALILMSFSLVLGSVGMYGINKNAFFYSSFYILLNIAYSLKLKHIPILDITIIAVGFVLRLLVGYTVIATEISSWPMAMTFLLALFLALAKRRDDVVIFLESGKKMRKVVDGYNLEFVNAAMTMMSAVVVVFYALYTVSQYVIDRIGPNNLYVTTGFVILGIMKYMQITFVYGNSGTPTEIILKDKFIQCTVVLWLITFGWIVH